MIFIGVDPGLNGAVATIDGDTCTLHDLPRLGPDLDWSRVDVILHGNSYHTMIGIEKVSAFPKQGVVSSFNFGKAYGGLVALASLHGSVELIPPRKWKAEYGLHKGKQDSLLVARRLFPTADLKLKKDHNKAEALLIAEYLRRRETGHV